MTFRRMFLFFILILFVIGFVIFGLIEKTGNSIYDDQSKYTIRENSFSYLSRKSSSIDDDLDMSFKVFDGIDTIYKSKSEDPEEITFFYTIELEEGRFKLIAINELEEVIEIHEGKGGGEYTLELPPGEVRIRILGDKAKGNLKFEIKK